MSDVYKGPSGRATAVLLHLVTLYGDPETTAEDIDRLLMRDDSVETLTSYIDGPAQALEAALQRAERAEADLQAVGVAISRGSLQQPLGGGDWPMLAINAWNETSGARQRITTLEADKREMVERHAVLHDEIADLRSGREAPTVGEICDALRDETEGPNFGTWNAVVDGENWELTFRRCEPGKLTPADRIAALEADKRRLDWFDGRGEDRGLDVPGYIIRPVRIWSLGADEPTDIRTAIDAAIDDAMRESEGEETG